LLDRDAEPCRNRATCVPERIELIGHDRFPIFRRRWRGRAER
jgi:hypothetical protein